MIESSLIPNDQFIHRSFTFCTMMPLFLYALYGIIITYLITFCREGDQTNQNTGMKAAWDLELETFVDLNPVITSVSVAVYNYSNDNLVCVLIDAGRQNNMGLDMLMNMFGGLGAGGFAVPNTPDGWNAFNFKLIEKIVCSDNLI